MIALFIVNILQYELIWDLTIVMSVTYPSKKMLKR